MSWEVSPVTPEKLVRRNSLFLGDMKPIADAVSAVAFSGAWEDDGGVFLAGHRSDIGTHVYDVVLFPPLLAVELEAYRRINRITFPESLSDILRSVNGCTLFKLNIFGVPRSMMENPARLDRSRRAPLDLATGRSWRSSYAKADPDDILFASRNVGWEGQIGYFMSATGRISGRGNGCREVLDETGPWERVGDWLTSELA